MKVKLPKTRRNGIQTRQTIIAAAKKLFLQKGFGATTLLEIAKHAGLNHSLIFHHFGNKEQLWKEVKQSLVPVDVLYELKRPERHRGLRVFLEQVIEKHFQFYLTHPDMLRLAEWQRLENDNVDIMESTSLSPDSWRDDILYFQQHNEIRSDLDPDAICLMLMCSLFGAFSNYRQFKQQPTKQRGYVSMLVDVYVGGLQPVG